ncbi:hypothetical protein H2200_001261 [Cladophialophora chaetospira]|uniref:GRF-type domain-containing protein n=1 Tax=Cladophialophora chaetospira TaxID=386627 RepID=A0AA39CPF1_9EURO|nr:hypothetical protein H2200_001261 [Cladophialophora chaetospira]
MATSLKSRNGRTTGRGLFVNGIWLCECEPRLPANKFRSTKPKSYGKWFYTCQKPQHKRCDFFLWTDDAKIREEGAVLANSRSEPEALVPPKTPRKQTTIGAFPTPQSRTKNVTPEGANTPTKVKDSGYFEPEETFEWSSSDDDELLKAEQELLERTPFETPKKASRTEVFTSPGKRTFAQMSSSRTVGDEALPLSDDVFTTPSTSHKPNGSGLRSPSKTPANRPTQSGLPEAEPSLLAAEALRILRDSNSQISSRVETELVELLNNHDLRTQGIIRGRDITRLAVQAKDKKIGELQARISTLESEKETNRRVISHLKMDIATSPKKGNGRSMPPVRRSEV